MLIKKKKERKYPQHLQKHYRKNNVVVWVVANIESVPVVGNIYWAVTGLTTLYIFIWATAAASVGDGVARDIQGFHFTTPTGGAWDGK